MSNRKYIYGHESQETAYVVNDYPWGFRLRTQIRYWIESKDAKNGGQRFVSQTMNPKTGKWCAPKKTTYCDIIIMFLDENNHIKYDYLISYSKKEHLDEFKETHLEKLTDFQKEKLKMLLAIENIMQHVTVEIKPSPIGSVSLFSKDPAEIEKRKQLIKEQELRKIEQYKNEKQICDAINYQYMNMEL